MKMLSVLTYELQVGDVWGNAYITRLEPPTSLKHLHDWSWMVFFDNGQLASSLGSAQWLIFRKEE